MVIWESGLVFSGAVQTPQLSPLLLNPRSSGDGDRHQEGGCALGEGSWISIPRQSQTCQFYQEGFHEPPLNLNFYEWASLYFMPPLERAIPSHMPAICLACWGSMSHRVPTGSHHFPEYKRHFSGWRMWPIQLSSSVSGGCLGLRESWDVRGGGAGRECQTLCKLETWWLECHFEMISLTVTFVFGCYWLRFSSTAQPFPPFLPLISLLPTIHILFFPLFFP